MQAAAALQARYIAGQLTGTGIEAAGDAIERAGRTALSRPCGSLRSFTVADAVKAADVVHAAWLGT
ncbi:MAG: hypothetical protein JOY64_35395 [Alphaproteobacteria bacterium]|nr:hypothetical protein [Alphaproteobacteria bacterium]